MHLLRYKDVKEEMKLVPFGIKESDEGGVLLENPQSEKGFSTPEEISSILLEKMIASVAETTNQTVSKAVISVPAYFDEAQREATITAGSVLRLILSSTCLCVFFLLKCYSTC